MSKNVICALIPHTISYYAAVPPEVPRALAQSGYDFYYCEDMEEYLRRLPDAEVVIASVFKKEWIDLAPRLKWVATYAAGKEWIPEQALLERGIKVTFGRFHGKIMAETVIGMMLFAARGLGSAYRLQQKVRWCDSMLFDELWTLRGKTCMILGLGNIGLHVARYTKFFGMYNIGVKRSPAAPVENVDEIIPLAELDRHLHRADHLVIILPNVPETDNIIDAGRLSRMKPTACLHNIGRGNCIDEDALYNALLEKKIHWACLDVFKNEPLSMDSPLRKLDNILILPHISAFCPEYFLHFFEEFLRDFEGYVNEGGR